MVKEFGIEFYGLLWNSKGAFILQIPTDEQSLPSHYFMWLGIVVMQIEQSRIQQISNTNQRRIDVSSVFVLY